MGRWDNKPTDDFDPNKPDKNALDEWNKANNNDFDWKETPKNEHEKKCTCPKCEYFVERAKTQRTMPIIYKYCPSHFKAWHETKDEMFKKMKWWQRQIVKFMFWRGIVKIQELSYMNSEQCIWCRFGSGGRGIKTDPLSPDMP